MPVRTVAGLTGMPGIFQEVLRVETRGLKGKQLGVGVLSLSPPASLDNTA